MTHNYSKPPFSDKFQAPSSKGPGFITLLTILFIGLKLTGYITWSWFWVLAPLWMTFLVVFALIMLAFWLQS